MTTSARPWRRMGGMGLPSPTGGTEYQQSLRVTEPLSEMILSQHLFAEYPAEDLRDRRRAVTKERDLAKKDLQEAFYASEAPIQLKKAVEGAAEPGASAWLTTLPLEENSWNFTREEWWDLVGVRYALDTLPMPSRCGCGEIFSLNHAMNCHTGGFVYARHNRVRDLLFDILGTLFEDVKKEPHLLSLSDEEKAALVVKYGTRDLGDHPRGDISGASGHSWTSAS